MRRLGKGNKTLGLLAGLVLVGTVQGCALSAADQDAIRRAWDARDAERAQECRRARGGFIAGGCVRGGP